jgi:hypothetical protein
VWGWWFSWGWGTGREERESVEETTQRRDGEWRRERINFRFNGIKGCKMHITKTLIMC